MKDTTENMVNALEDTPKRGRKPQETAPQETLPVLAPEVVESLESDAAAVRTIDAAVQSVVARQFESAKMIGQMQAVGLFKKFAGTADLVLMKQMKESKAYKGMQVPQTDGGVLAINTFDEFCTLMGRSRRTVDEDIQNLNAFGEEFMEAAQGMGLGYRDLRKLRTLPDEARTLVIESEKAGNDPEALKDLLEELAAKLARERDEHKESRATLEARDKVLSAKSKSLDRTQEELTKLKNLPPDDAALLQAERERNALKELHADGLHLLGMFTKYLATAKGILDSHEFSRHAAQAVLALTGGMCSQIADDLLGVVDIDFRYIVYPAHLGDLALRGDDRNLPADEE